MCSRYKIKTSQQCFYLMSSYNFCTLPNISTQKLTRIKFLHNLNNCIRRRVRKMPRFSEGIWTHKIHPVHMAVNFFRPASTTYLRFSQTSRKNVRVQKLVNRTFLKDTCIKVKEGHNIADIQKKLYDWSRGNVMLKG